MSSESTMPNIKSFAVEGIAVWQESDPSTYEEKEARTFHLQTIPKNADSWKCVWAYSQR